MKIIGHVKEGGKMGDKIGFNFVETQSGYNTYSWFPRPRHGGSTLEGFAFSFKDDGKWETFLSEISDKEFIRKLYCEYSGGYSAEKIYFFIISDLVGGSEKPYIKGHPHPNFDKVRSSLFCKLQLPEAYGDLVYSVIGA
jgi:hypothetical protein